MAKNSPTPPGAGGPLEPDDPNRPQLPWQDQRWGWDPFLGLGTIRNTMREMLSDLFLREGGQLPPDYPWRPDIDLYESGNRLVVEIPLPGVRKDEIQIQATHDLLIVRGALPDVAAGSEGRYFAQERRRGAFSRSIPLPYPVKPEAITAEAADGVLTVTLPIRGRPRRKTYKVRID